MMSGELIGVFVGLERSNGQNQLWRFLLGRGRLRREEAECVVMNASAFEMDNMVVVLPSIVSPCCQSDLRACFRRGTTMNVSGFSYLPSVDLLLHLFDVCLEWHQHQRLHPIFGDRAIMNERIPRNAG
jgi:hypothetical protein